MASDDRGFVVVWDDRQDSGEFGVFARRFDASAAPQGPELRVNSYTTSHQAFPSVVAVPDGRFTVVWTSQGQDGSSVSVFGQRLGPDVIFVDGFE